MRAQRNLFASCCLALSLALAPLAAAGAQEKAPGDTTPGDKRPGPQQESPSELARESLEQMMRALRLMVESIPQYELPEVLDNGDIIIRRKRDQAAPDPEFDETAT